MTNICTRTKSIIIAAVEKSLFFIVKKVWMKVVEQRKRRKRVCVRRPHISFRFSGILKIAADAAALLQTCNNATLCWRKQDIHIHHTDGHKHPASMHCDSVGSAVGLDYATAAHTRRFAALTEQQRQWWNHALSNPLYTGFDGNQYALSRVYFFSSFWRDIQFERRRFIWVCR